MSSLVSISDSYEKNNVKDVYNIIAQEFTNSRPFQWYWIYDFIHTNNKFNNEIDDCIIYDIGCGSGRNMSTHKEKIKFIGFDFSQSFVDICKKEKLEVYLSDMTELPVKDESCHHIISIASFHHLSTIERRKSCLNEMIRVLKNKKESRILLSVWSKTQPKKSKNFNKFTYGDNIVTWNKIYNRYYYIFSKKELEELFKDVGLEVEKHEWIYGNEIYTLMKRERDE